MAHNVLKAHGKAVRMLRQYGRQLLEIGFAPTCSAAYPEREILEAARQAMFALPDDLRNWTWNIPWWSDPVLLGHYPEEGLKRFAPYLPKTFALLKTAASDRYITILLFHQPVPIQLRH